LTNGWFLREGVNVLGDEEVVVVVEVVVDAVVDSLVCKDLLRNRPLFDLIGRGSLIFVVSCPLIPFCRCGCGCSFHDEPISEDHAHILEEF